MERAKRVRAAPEGGEAEGAIKANASRRAWHLHHCQMQPAKVVAGRLTE